MNSEYIIDPVTNLLSIFRDNGLQCIFLREECFLSLQENDLDFWCSAAQKDKVINIILAQGWFVIGGRTCKSDRGESHVLRFTKTGVHPVFELWMGDLRANALIYCSSKEIVNNARSQGDIFLTDAFLLNLLILRPVLKRRDMEKYSERISKLKISENQLRSWLENCDEKFGSKVTEICRGVLNRKFVTLSRFEIFKLVLNQYSISAIIALLCGNLFTSANEFIYQPPLVSFIGTDGSGKSTTAEAFLGFLQSREIKARYLYAGRSRNNSWPVRMARSIIFKLGLAKRITKEEWGNYSVANDKYGKKQSGLIIQLIALLVYFVEYHFRYLKIRLISRFNKQVQILDRGSWDIATIDGLGQLPVRLAMYAPHADITFFCYTKPGIIQKRKLERSVPEIIRHQAIYKYLGDCSDNVFVYLDTSQEKESINQLVAHHFSTVIAMKNGQLDKKTASLFLSMRLSIWENLS